MERSIKYKMAISVGLALIVLFTVFIAYDFFSLKRTAVRELDENSNAKLERLKNSLTVPLWDLNNKDAKWSKGTCPASP